MEENKLRELIRQYINDNCGEYHDEDDVEEISGTDGAPGYEKPIEDDEDELEEITVTADADGYSTPSAFRKTNGRKKKKAGFTKGHKKPNVFGYSVVKESLDKKDIEIIRKLIRDVISDVYRDIWIKRNTWK